MPNILRALGGVEGGEVHPLPRILRVSREGPFAAIREGGGPALLQIRHKLP